MKYVECPHCKKQADTPPFVHGWMMDTIYSTKKCQKCGKELKIKPLVIVISIPIFALCTISVLASLILLGDFINKNTLNIQTDKLIIGAIILLFPIGFPLGIFWAGYIFPFIMGDILGIKLFRKR